MELRHRTMTALVALLAVAGCEAGTGLEPGRPVERTSSALLTFHVMPRFLMAMDLIGRSLNGMSLNGKVLDGRWIAAVSLEDVRLARGGHKDLRLKATDFVNGGRMNLVKARRELVGATFTAMLDDGDTVPLHVDDVQPSPDPATPHLRYAVSYPSDGGWEPLCGVDEAGSPVLAIPLEGVWDYREGLPGGGAWHSDRDAFTFACEGFVLAKCVAMGYPPWVEGRLCQGTGSHLKCGKATLAAHHQACARMLRADFCGDGTSFTVDGTWVNAYDGIGVRNDTEDWALEAEWTPAGASCAMHERLRAAGVEPPCMAALALPDCGDPAHFEQGSLLMSESEIVRLP